MTNTADFQNPIVKVDEDINLQQIMDVDSIKEGSDDGYTANDEVGQHSSSSFQSSYECGRALKLVNK